MNDKITNVNLEEFLNDHLERSKIILLEEGKEQDDIMAVAQAKGYILKDSNDLAGFKTIYTFDTAANINKARLPKELLLKALPGLIGKPVDIDHNRIYVVGHYIDYRYIASKHMVIAYGVFYKSNFGEEWIKAKELFKAGKLGTSYEIWCPKSKRKYLPDGTYILTNMEIAGGGLMFKEKPAFPDAKVLELAMKHIDEQKTEYLVSTKKNYEACELIFAAGYNYDAKVGNVNKTTTPANDKLYMADELIGKPVSVQLPSPILSDKNIGFEKPIIGLPKHDTQVGISIPSKTIGTPGNLTDLAEKNALKNTGLQPDRLKNDNLGDNVSVPGPQIVASMKCQNCAKEFTGSPQTFQRKNSIDFYEVARTDDMHQCPQCKSIINRQGFMLHPPQIIDFGMACPSCRSSNWRLLTNEPETADVKCMNCSKAYHFQFAKPENNPLIGKFNFLREGNSSCPQCHNMIPYSTISNAEVKSLTCRKCGLHYGINLNKSGSSRKVSNVNEFVQQEDYMAIAPTGGTGKETAPQSASVKHTAPKQKFVTRSNQGIVDHMAGQNQDVDNILTKNLKTEQNKPQNEGGTIFLVRHGKTKLNAGEKPTEDKVRGWKNVPLDSDGRQEARELGQIFKGQKIDKLYSSDLQRAYDTAAQISRGTGTPVTNKFDLRPWNLGVHQGELSNKVHPIIMKSASETPHIKVKGGESFNNFKSRALNFARKLIEEAKQGKKVVAVTHTRVAKLIQAWIAAGCPDDNSIDHNEFMKDTIKTGSIHKIEPTDKGVKVTEIENLQQASILDNTTQSSDKGGITMSQENSQEVKVEVPTAEVKAEVVATPVVETPAPVVEAEAAIEVESAEAVEQEEALEVSKTLKAEDRDKLSNDDFAVIKTVKDKNGSKTVRKYPIHDKAHVQNALARLHQAPSRDGLKKLGVDPDAVITKVKAKAKKMGMEDAEIEGYSVSSQGTDMQKVNKRGSKTNPTEVVSASADGIEEAKKVTKVKTGDNAVEGLTPDQVNQMQNQLFANMKKAMTYRKYHKASMKNIKQLKKAMMDGVYASVTEVEVVQNMNIDGKKTTTVSDVGTGEKPTEAVTTGKAPVPVDDCITIDNNDGAKAKDLSDALKPAAIGEKVDVIVAPATPVANAEIDSKGTTKTDAMSDGVSKPAEGITTAGDSKAVVNLDQNLEAEKLAKELIPATPGEALKPGSALEPIMAPAAEVVNMEVKSKGTETPVSTVSDAKVTESKGTGSDTKVETIPVTPAVTDTEVLKASVESLQKEIEGQKEKIKILETAAVKLIERRNALGEFGKDLSDKDILDDDKFEVAKIKAENKALKHELNTASSHIAETTIVRGEDDTKKMSQEIKRKAQKLY